MKLLKKKNFLFSQETHGWAEIVANLVCQGYVRDGRWHVLAVIQQCHDTGVEGFQAAAIVSVALANPTGVLQVTGPRQTQSAHLKVAIGEHVGQAKSVVILLCKKKKNIIF